MTRNASVNYVNCSLKYFVGITHVVSVNSKDNPLMLSDKSPVEDQNEWWIKSIKLRESDCILLLNVSDLNDNLINAAHFC